MRKILPFVLLFFAVGAFAQQDNKAKTILEQVKEKTKSFTSISADFVFSMKNVEMEINEQNEGSIKLKGKKYSVNLPKLGVTVFSDGITLWNYMKEGNQVTITNIEDEGSELMDPSSLFSIYEKGFESKYIGEKNEGGKTIIEIELYPDMEDYEISKITVFINKANYLIHAATLYETEGNEYGILVKRMETDKNYPDAEFVFDASKYPDVEVIDFR